VADRPIWSLREFVSTFYVAPRTSPDFAWAFASRFLFILAYGFPPKSGTKNWASTSTR